MLKRLGIGLVKGLILGIALGVGFQVGLGWTAAGLGGFLLAMGIGATAGIVCGKPPWKAEAWIESLLKGVAGVGVGALLYWVASSFLSFDMPWALPGAAEGTAWVAQPMLWAPIVGLIFGAVVELDNSDEDKAGKDKPKAKKRKGPRTRVTGDLDLGLELEESGSAAKKERA